MNRNLMSRTAPAVTRSSRVTVEKKRKAAAKADSDASGPMNRAQRRAVARIIRTRQGKPRKRNGTRHHSPFPISTFAGAMPKGRPFVKPLETVTVGGPAGNDDQEATTA